MHSHLISAYTRSLGTAFQSVMNDSVPTMIPGENLVEICIRLFGTVREAIIYINPSPIRNAIRSSSFQEFMELHRLHMERQEDERWNKLRLRQCISGSPRETWGNICRDVLFSSLCPNHEEKVHLLQESGLLHTDQNFLAGLSMMRSIDVISH